MKKMLFFGAALITLTACSFHKELEPTKNPGTHAEIGFSVAQKNMTKASLQDAEHYNFGVFAYKSTDQVNWVMDNYLVGYYDDAKAYQKTGSTVEDKPGVVDGQSYWMYEGMGKKEYGGTYAGGTLTRFYQSNKDNQYLKYWDLSAPTTSFYAYAPYVGTDDANKCVTYVDGVAQQATEDDTYTLNFPDGTIVAGMNDASKHEYMYAATKVAKADYGHDVSLNFKRLVAKVNIKFWEDVPGYKVRIIDLIPAGANGNSVTPYGVAATPSINDNSSGNYGYKTGTYYASNGVKIKFNSENLTAQTSQYTGKTINTPLNFAVPTASVIGEDRYAAVASLDTYYAVPKGAGADQFVSGSTTDADLAKTGFTFHVSYELTADDSGEHIIVKDATVHVPNNYCNWEMNKHYTYIFKITKGSNGTTGESNPDPTDPEVPTVQSLYPIIFDNCTVTDWEESETEWEIGSSATPLYHKIELSSYSVMSGSPATITVTLHNSDTNNGAQLDYTKVTVTGPSTSVTYDLNNKNITVPANATAGTYTVTYTCPDYNVNNNHPQKWTATFTVGHAYTVSTSHAEIGCNSTSESAKLTVSATMDNSSYSIQTGELSIDYPENITDNDNVSITNNEIVVKRAAKPGVYKVVLTVGGNKVAETTFTVVDYNFTLSHSVVFNNGAATTVTANQSADNNHVYSVEVPSGATAITVSSDSKSFEVPANAAEGTYTVSYKVYTDAVYKKTFEVRNTHSVSLDKNQIDRNPGSTSDKITITAKINGGVPTSSVQNSLSVVTIDENGGETAAQNNYFTIASDSSDKSIYTLSCTTGVPNGTYYVKFVQDIYNASKENNIEQVAKYAKFTVIE